MNINVVGTSGSGKSTLARRLAHRLELPWIELDRLYWRPNWQGAPDEAFFAAIAAATATPGWVLDGNYNRSRSVKWRAVDLVIWVDYGFWRTLRQAVWRAATSGAVAGHGQLREFSPFVLQPGIHHPLDAENLAAASPTLSGRYAGSAISSYSLRPGAQSAAGRGAAPRAGSAAFSRAYLIFSSTHVN